MVNYFQQNAASEEESEYENDSNNTDSDADSEIDEIYEEEIEYSENRTNYEYYIGITKLIKPYSYYLLLNTVSATTFFLYPHKTILHYLSEYSIIETYKPKIDILKLIIINDVYTVIKKTYWIRLVQRHWKKVLKDRHNMILQRGRIASQRNFEITGKYPPGLRVLPGLYGMLSTYNNSSPRTA